MIEPKSLLAQFLTSPGLRACRHGVANFSGRLGGKSRQAECYLRIDDPYSYLLVQLAPKIMAVCKLDLEPIVISELRNDCYPEEKMLFDYAVNDAKNLAEIYRLDYQARSDFSVQEKENGSAHLLNASLAEDCWPQLQQVFLAYWSKSITQIEKLKTVDITNERLSNNNQRLKKRGHYLSATIYYAGEWYWGLDRLIYLEQRLSGKKTHFNHDQHHWLKGPAGSGKGKQLDFYFSFRSPYSYILLERLFKWVDHYAVELKIKPVLPMVMRGLKVPRVKRTYIVLDSKREAERHDISFGKISDPVGLGVERALAIYPLAEEKGLARAYLLSVTQGVWSEGKNIAKDHDLRSVCERAGLPWDDCLSALQDHSWQQWSEKNRQDLYALGCWGVPSLKMDNFIVWGQDRLWALDKYINQ